MYVAECPRERESLGKYSRCFHLAALNLEQKCMLLLLKVILLISRFALVFCLCAERTGTTMHKLLPNKEVP